MKPQTDQARGNRRVCCEGASRFPYLGKEYSIEIRNYRSYRKPGVMLEEDKLVVLTADIADTVVNQALYQWYLERAKEIIPQRIALYQPLVDRPVAGIRIKNVRSRWGSCSSKGNLNFNWRLVMMPFPVLDYVVVHELCHLKEMNHGSRFWKLVQEILPDYQQQRSWLKECRYITQFP